MVKVTFLTPVFNGAAFLQDAIESILRQTHQHWDYVIVDNCSTDGTAAIAREYARRDSRIRVYSNEVFLNADENHNVAFRYVPSDAQYVKVVAADDWIADDCVEKMVALAERHPSVGVVGAYQMRGPEVLWAGIPRGTSVLSGRDAARLGLLHGVHVLGAPTSVLYRADLVRARRDFFPHVRPHADTDACYEVFGTHDFGFVHEPLAFDRIRPGQESTRVKALDGNDLYYLETLMRYGPRFLLPGEYVRRVAEVEDSYYRVLARGLLKLRGPAFWRFHVRESRAAGCRIRLDRVMRSAAEEAWRLVRRPGRLLSKLRSVSTGHPGDA